VLNRRRLVWDCFVGLNPVWTPLLTHIGYALADDVDISVGGHSLGVFKRDWRTAPLTEKWAELLELRNSSLPSDDSVDPSSVSRLGRAEFDAAVKQALRDLRRPDLLVHNPLLGCRLMDEAAQNRPSSEALVALIDRPPIASAAPPRREAPPRGGAHLRPTGPSLVESRAD